MASVRLENISKSFDEKKSVIDSVNIYIEDKSFVVIIGPSGCGKTTLLNIIAGLEFPSSGNVFINDKCVNKIEPKDRDIAMVFQSYALYPHLTVYDNLAFALRIKRIRKEQIDRKVKDVAALLGISDFLRRKPKQLSGGQMQRVAIGKAIVRDPLVFLMDEPLSNLDASLKNSMRYELKKLHADLATTFIYVTHDQVEAMTLATLLVVMNEGKIQQVGTPYEVFMNPRNIFVAQFIGVPRMNLLPCSITNRKGLYFANFLGSEFQIDISNELAIDEFLNSEIVVGVRPEDVVISKNETGFPLNVIHSEVTGSEIVLHCETDIAGNSLLIRSSLEETSMNLKQIKVFPRVHKLHFFRLKDGERLKLTCSQNCEVINVQ